MTLRSTTDHSGATYFGVLLSLPSHEGDVFVWDHVDLPDGTLDEAGEFTPRPDPPPFAPPSN